MKLWTETYAGTIHAAAAMINEFTPHLAPHLMQLTCLDSEQGPITTGLFCVSLNLYEALRQSRLNAPLPAPEDGEKIVVAGGADGTMFSLDTQKP